MKIFRALSIATGFIAATLIATSASATTIGITSAGSLTANGLINWGSLGADGTNVPSVTSIPVTGVAGLNATVSQPGGDFLRANEGNSWVGNFASGETLLWTFVDGDLGRGPITLNFTSAIQGFGTRIQPDHVGGFTARIEAFNASSVSLGSFTLPAADSTAPFIGLLSSSADISRIVLSLTASPGGGQDFAINNPIIQTATPAGVPEPLSMLLVGSGLAGAAFRQRRARRKS